MALPASCVRRHFMRTLQRPRRLFNFAPHHSRFFSLPCQSKIRENAETAARKKINSKDRQPSSTKRCSNKNKHWIEQTIVFLYFLRFSIMFRGTDSWHRQYCFGGGFWSDEPCFIGIKFANENRRQSSNYVLCRQINFHLC